MKDFKSKLYFDLTLL